jgi:hypothetical protein
MKQATIEFRSKNLGQSAAGLVYGGLYLQVDEQQFPDSRWTDFVVVVLAWWCKALTEVLSGVREPIEVRFMEGPYLAMIGPKSAASIHLQLVDAGLRRRIRYEAEVQIDQLVDSALSAAGEALSECRRRNWWSKDSDELEFAIAALKRERVRILN